MSTSPSAEGSGTAAVCGPAARGLAALLLAALAWTAGAAETGEGCRAAAGARPAIGLALSGGGARGGAHIGALQALEELRVPIDCIAGTSVGAVVGGFYAAGRSAAEIESLAANLDWSNAFLNATPRQSRSFRRKRDDYLYLFNLSPGIRGRKFSLPIGLVQGQVFDTIIERMLSGAYDVRDFDRLGVPFRAVATDISNGAAVVLGSGDLPLALRASMSLPAVLTPVDIDGRMLVDGGLAMNLPVEVVQAMGADRVIAVDATSALLPRESMRSVVDVAGQLTTLLTRAAIERQRDRLAPDDVLVTPTFGSEATFANFALLAATIERGYDAVMEQRERLAPWALDETGYRAYRARRAERLGAPTPRIDFVQLDNRSTVGDRAILARLGRLPLGGPLDVPAVERAVGRVYGLELFQNVRYSVVHDDAGRTGLAVRVDERSWGPGYVQLGMRYNSSSAADTTIGIAASYLRTGIDARGGEWRTTLAIGSEPGFATGVYEPLGPKALFFVEPRAEWRSTLYNVFDGDRVASAIDIRESVLEASGGRELRGATEIRAGVRGGGGVYRVHAGDPAFAPADSFRRGEAFVRLSVDTLDGVAFPRAGAATSVEWRRSSPTALGADEPFTQLLARASVAKSWRRHTVLGALRYDATTSGTAPLYARFRMGGFRDLSGLDRGQLTGQQAARAGVSYYRAFGDSMLFPAFAGITVERGNVWEKRSDVSFGAAIAGVSVWAGIGTPVGPVYLGTGRTDDGRSAVYLALGGAF